MALAADEFLEGRYAVFGAVAAAPSRFTVVVKGPGTRTGVGFRASTAEDLVDLPLADRSYVAHFPSFPRAGVPPRDPAELDAFLALWRAAPKALLVTPRVDLDEELLPGAGSSVPAGEPLLVEEAGAQAIVVTVDGRRLSVSPKFLVARAPEEPTLPAKRRGTDGWSADDDETFAFVSDAARPAWEKFRKADEQAEACWSKHYNPKGRGYDLATHRNGRLVNVESLGERFRRDAERACRKVLDAAATARARIQKQLFAERVARHEQVFEDAKAAARATCASK